MSKGGESFRAYLPPVFSLAALRGVCPEVHLFLVGPEGTWCLIPHPPPPRGGVGALTCSSQLSIGFGIPRERLLVFLEGL